MVRWTGAGWEPANVSANQALVLQQPLTPPVRVTFVVRVNGTTCDEVFIGLVGTNESIFNDSPSAGLFVSNDLEATFNVAPTPTSFALPIGEQLRAPNEFARLTVTVDGASAQLLVDGEGPHDDDLRPVFGDAAMYPAVQVGGGCSVDLDAVWATPSGLPAATVAVEPAVTLKLAF
jgi:hypothetical protein